MVEKKAPRRRRRSSFPPPAIANLADGFARTWRRPPTKEELQGLSRITSATKFSIARAGRRGLDRDDVVIRRRVRQKMEFLAEDISTAEPTKASLRPFSLPIRIVSGAKTACRSSTCFSVQRVAPVPSIRIEAGRGRHFRRRHTGGCAELGDPFLLGAEFHSVSPRDVASTFGEGFASRIFSLDQGRWSGPIASTFGQHFVFVTDRHNGSVPPLDSVRAAVAREWTNARRSESEQKLYRSLRDRYEISVEGEPLKTTAARP